MALATLLLAVVAACGGDGDGEEASTAGVDLGEAIGSDASGSSTTSPSTSPEGVTTTSTAPTTTPTPVPLAVTDVGVPGAAPAGIDACSEPVSYEGTNLVDGLTGSAWRMAGDATGQWLSFQLDGSHRVLGVSLLPGYAKVDPCDGADRWGENRRPVSVTWRFDDGTEVTQPLSDSPTVQQVAVDATTSTVSLRIDGVTAAPVRDFTAISEVAVHGV